MQEVPGLEVFDSHDIIDRKEDDVEVQITTFAHLTPLDWVRLAKAGCWVRRAENVAAYIKPKFTLPDLQDIEIDFEEVEE